MDALVTRGPLFVNDSNGNHSGDPLLSRSSAGLRVFAGCMTIVIIILGIIGNSLTIAALIQCPKMRNLTVAFIISLCIADLSFSLVVMPFRAHHFLTGVDFAASHPLLCVLHPLVQYANVGVSLISIAMITINRFVMIAYHSHYGRIYTKASVAGMVAFTWIFSFAILIPTLCGKWGEFGLDPRLGSCSIIETSTSAKMSLFLIGFITPCIAIVICYAGIFWVVRKSGTRVRTHKSSVAEDGRTTRSGSDWRLTKMILAIFLSFVICYLPTTLIKVLDRRVQYPNAHVISYVLIYFSACINPIIYVTMNRQYRQAYMSVLCMNKRSNYSASDRHGCRPQTAVSHTLSSSSRQNQVPQAVHIELMNRFSRTSQDDEE